MGNHIVKDFNPNNYPDKSFILLTYLPENKTNKHQIIEWLNKCFIKSEHVNEIIKEINKPEWNISGIRYMFNPQNKILYLHISLINNITKKMSTQTITSLHMNENI